LDTNLADTATSHALLNCLVREVSRPAGRAGTDGLHLVARLAHADLCLRARLRCPAAGPADRLEGPVEELAGGAWRPIGWRRLADLVAGELQLVTGEANLELAGQVAASHGTVAALVAARGRARPPSDDYLESEQSLVAGHRFHPAAKARPGVPLAYAPEAYARFPLRGLAVRADLVREEHAGGAGALEALGGAPEGYVALPAHPWQLALLRQQPSLRAALRDGRVLDLGQAERTVVPTSSVRTVYDPAADAFYKFSLDVRITNCVRKTAWYELAGSVALSRLLPPVFAEIGRRFPGTVLLAEPAYRTVDLGDRRLFEGLAVIVRQGVRRCTAPGVTPLLAAAIADEHGAGRAAVARLLRRGGASRDHALAWWSAYVARVASPALHAFLEHGVVLEAHLQNVLVGVGPDGMPVQAIFRDLEGTKLVGQRHAAALSALPDRVREALTYDAERGWARVAYCLVVNHLAEVAAAIACARPGIERDLWEAARDRFAGDARELGSPPELRALLAGTPLPAKANLRARWARVADRRATYVPVANPLACGVRA
jgi:siderophore synthetase component